MVCCEGDAAGALTVTMPVFGPGLSMTPDACIQIVAAPEPARLDDHGPWGAVESKIQDWFEAAVQFKEPIP